MKTSLKSYPHPVLGNEDDVGGVFRVGFEVELSKKEIGLNSVFNLKNKAIEELIKKGKASFVVEIECGSTFYRNSFSTRTPSYKFSIPAKLLRERVTAGFYICADIDIANYSPSECHPDYQEAVFEIEKGDVLAIGGYCTFIAEKAFDPMRPPINSFVTIVKSPNKHTGSMEVDYSSDKITIELSKADHDNYLQIIKDKSAYGIIHASIVMPVLIDAIHHIKAENTDYTDKNWYGRLESILETKGLANKSAFEAAQIILESPVTRNFEGIMSMLELNMDEEI